MENNYSSINFKPDLNHCKRIQLLQLFATLTVILSLWGPGIVAEEYVDFNLEALLKEQKPQVPINLMDPAGFTPEILKCHQKCGDDYYECSFFTCDFETDFESEQFQTLRTKQHVTIWDRFLYNFSFGFLGTYGTPHQDKKKESVTKGDHLQGRQFSLPERKIMEEVCLDNCTQHFRQCYKHCLCTAFPQSESCQPIPTFTAKMDGIDNGNGGYAFDWNNLAVK